MQLPRALAEAWMQSFHYCDKTKRIDYWLFQIATNILFVGLGIALGISDSQFLFIVIVIYAIANIFPTVAISVRRLRDAGKRWTWLFVSLIPFIGGVWYIVLMCLPSSSQPPGRASKA
tara:strand:+ start:179 stop:532 length:354 start_codon:yes stop_codon:yes gene_type:complete